jgi:hypothetical protein
MHQRRNFIRIEPLETRTLLSGPYGGSQFLVYDDPSGEQSDPVVAMDAAGNFVVAWDTMGEGSPDADIFARRFTAAGQPLGQPFQVNTTTPGVQFAPSISMNAKGDFAIAWQDRNDSAADVYVRKFTAAGVPLGDDHRANTIIDGEQMMPSVAIDASGKFVVVWSGQQANSGIHDIAARRFGADGSPLADEFWVAPSESTQDIGAHIAHAPDGRFVVAWASWDGAGNTGMYARTFDAPDLEIGPIIHVDPRIPGAYFFIPAADPIDLAVDADGGFVVAWAFHDVGFVTTILSRRFDDLSAAVGDTFEVGQGDFTRSVSAALDADNHLTVVWERAEEFGFPHDIVARQFDKANQPLQPHPFGIAIQPGESNVIPAIAMNGAGDFAVVWRIGEGLIPTADYRIAARLFTANDFIPPQVSSSNFEFESAQSLKLHFTEDVSLSLDSSDLVVKNTTTGQTLSSGDVSVVFDVVTNTATVRFGPDVLPNGNYTATVLASGVTDQAGNALAADYVADFFVLAGDANRDGAVNSDDFNILAGNFGLSGKTFSQGNFSYDPAGLVNSLDFNILATNFGTSLGASFSTARIGIRAGRETAPRSEALRDRLA